MLILSSVLEMFMLILVISLKEVIPKSQEKKSETKTLDKGLEACNGGKVTGEQSWGAGGRGWDLALERTWALGQRRKPWSRGSTGDRPEFCS